MTRTACHSTDSLVSYLGGHGLALTEEIRQEFESHIEHCELCRKTLSQIAQEQWNAPPQLPTVEEASELTISLARIKDKVLSVIQRPVSIPEIPGYRVTRELGRGGAAVVYHGEQLQPAREVAIKMLLDTRRSDSRALSRFHAEIDSIARLNHRNIVPILEVGSFEHTIFYTMPYITGGSLANQLKRKSYKPLQAARIIRDLARAAAAAHAAGLVHRDIKPDNVLLQPNDSMYANELDFIPRLTDFGIAKQMAISSSVTRTGEIVGTPCYMAPEQIRGDRESGATADVYSLGAILYELLTGRPPFQSHSSTETMLQALRDEPIPIRRLQRQVPQDLERICTQAIARQPHLRYTTADQLSQDLDRFLEGHPVQARRVSWLGRTWKWSQRQPAIASLFTALILTTITLLVMWAQFTWQLKKQRDLAENSARKLADEQKLTLQNFDQAFDAIRNYLEAVQSSPQLASDDTIEIRMELLETGSTFYTDLLQRNQRVSELPAARRTTEKIHLEQARLFFNLGKLNYSVGDLQVSLGQFDTAQEICHRILGDSPFPIDRSDAGLPGSIWLSSSKALLECGRIESCLIHAQAGLEYFQRVSVTELLSLDYRNWYLAESWLRVAEAQFANDAPDRAMQSYQEALSFSLALPAIPDFQLTRINVMTGIAQVHQLMDRINPARDQATQAVEINRQLVSNSPKERRYREALARTMLVQAKVMMSAEMVEQAYHTMEEALIIQRELVGRFPNSQRLNNVLLEMERIETNLSSQYQSINSDQNVSPSTSDTGRHKDN